MKEFFIKKSIHNQKQDTFFIAAPNAFRCGDNN